jgi:GIY-YIG catalytic domain
MLGEKLPQPIPNVSGIYQIRCKVNGKIYIGSAVALNARWLKHRTDLRRGKHRNSHLQFAWDKYGEESFDFSVLEFATRGSLLQVEQNWIDKTGCANRKIGFNIYPVAGSPGDTFVQEWKGFIDPQGNAITITNLFDFCREHGLDFPSMHRLAKGVSKLKSYKGWTHCNSVRQRDYVKTYEGFIDPDGNAVGPITNLAAFCRERGLDNTHMIALIKGKLCSHQGWTHKDGKQQIGPKVYTGFISPKGQRVTIINLKAFCEKYELCQVHMHELKSGKRKSHKGWTWRADDE